MIFLFIRRLPEGLHLVYVLPISNDHIVRRHVTCDNCVKWISHITIWAGTFSATKKDNTLIKKILWSSEDDIEW